MSKHHLFNSSCHPLFEGDVHALPSFKTVLVPAGTRVPEITTQPVEITATTNRYGIELRFHFPRVRKRREEWPASSRLRDTFVTMIPIDFTRDRYMLATFQMSDEDDLALGLDRLPVERITSWA